jgi:hypothetical protein
LSAKIEEHFWYLHKMYNNCQHHIHKWKAQKTNKRKKA